MASTWSDVLGGLLATVLDHMVSITLVLSAVEYAVIGILVQRTVAGRRLHRLAGSHGWTITRGDPGRTLRALEPPSPGPLRARRIRCTVHGDSPQGGFTLWLHRNPRRWRAGRHTVYLTTPWATSRVLSPRILAHLEAQPDMAICRRAGCLVLSRTNVRDLRALQELVRTADWLRALAPRSGALHPGADGRLPTDRSPGTFDLGASGRAPRTRLGARSM